MEVGHSVQPLLREGKKEASAGGWLPAALRGPSTSYSLRHGNQKPEVFV